MDEQKGASVLMARPAPNGARGVVGLVLDEQNVLSPNEEDVLLSGEGGNNDDEAYARQLQEEDNRHLGIGSFHSRSAGLQGVQRNEVRNVRVNVLNDVRTHGVTKRGLIFHYCVYIPQIIAVAVVFGLNPNEISTTSTYNRFNFTNCDKNLVLWSFVYAVKWIGGLVVATIQLRQRDRLVVAPVRFTRADR